MKKLPKNVLEYDTPQLISVTGLALKELRRRLATEGGNVESMDTLSPAVDELLTQLMSTAPLFPRSRAVKWLTSGQNSEQRLKQRF